MAPNERARKNHDELFLNHVSTLAGTDPELIDFIGYPRMLNTLRANDEVIPA